MTEDLEALVSHLHVVGGRAVSAPPPGALVQLAPKRSPRIRERDALFVLVLPARETHANAVFYEEMARTAAQRYFEQDGPIAAGLALTLTSLNADLFRHNQANPQQPFYAEMACLVLRNQADQRRLYARRLDRRVAGRRSSGPSRPAWPRPT